MWHNLNWIKRAQIYCSVFAQPTVLGKWAVCLDCLISSRAMCVVSPGNPESWGRTPVPTAGKQGWLLYPSRVHWCSVILEDPTLIQLLYFLRVGVQAEVATKKPILKISWKTREFMPLEVFLCYLLTAFLSLLQLQRQGSSVEVKVQVLHLQTKGNLRVVPSKDLIWRISATCVFKR